MKLVLKLHKKVSTFPFLMQTSLKLKIARTKKKKNGFHLQNYRKTQFEKKNKFNQILYNLIEFEFMSLQNSV